MANQTSYELVKNLVTKGPAERMGLNDHPWSDTLEKWITQGYPADESGEPIPPVEHFDFDMDAAGAWFPWIAKQIDEEIVEESDEWKLVKDGNGATFKWWKHKSGTPEHYDFEMTTREIWERDYKPHVVGSAATRASDEMLEKSRNTIEAREGDRWLDLGFRGLWENMRAAFGDIALYESMLLDPDWIIDYCRTYTDLYIEELDIADSLRRSISLLPEREERILALRYGFLDGVPRTLEEIGEEFNLTRERIRQLEKLALSRLRHPSFGIREQDMI